MISNAKALSLTVVVFATSFGAANMAIKGRLDRQPSAANAAYAASAAFRDGMYAGKMDAQLGRTQHLMTGRWSSNQDRRLFVMGYMQSYAQAQGSTAGKSNPDELSIARGYFDGLSDGMNDRRASSPFRLLKTANYLRSGKPDSQASAGVAEEQQSYRAAYSNGYQQGFYAAE